MFSAGVARGPYSSVQGFGLDVPYADAQGSTKSAPASTGSLCSSAANATALQAMLADLGFYHGKIDGMMGTGTRSAVQAFAASQGIDAGSFFPSGSICQSIMDAWQAAKAPKAAPTPAPSAPSALPHIIINPALLAAFVKSKAAATPGGGGAAAPGASGGVTGWWAAQSQTTKIGIGVGATAVLLLGVYAATRPPTTATPNR